MGLGEKPVWVLRAMVLCIVSDRIALLGIRILEYCMSPLGGGGIFVVGSAGSGIYCFF